jgi:hypothetical protein
MRALSFVTQGISLLLAAGISATPAMGQEPHRFRAAVQVTSRIVPAPAGRCNDEPGHAPVIGVLEIVGGGDASLLGPIVDEQSNCLRADLSFFSGRFTFKNAAGDTITGQYFGQLVPTFNAAIPSSGPPAGVWLILGNACIAQASTRQIHDDCADGRFQPARGITNLSTGDGSIYLDQVVAFDR